MVFDFILRSEVVHLSGLFCKIDQWGKRNVDQQKYFLGFLIFLVKIILYYLFVFVKVVEKKHKTNCIQEIEES